jgi:hypothetical protein
VAQEPVLVILLAATAWHHQDRNNASEDFEERPRVQLWGELASILEPSCIWLYNAQQWQASTIKLSGIDTGVFRHAPRQSKLSMRVSNSCQGPLKDFMP